MTTWIIGTGGSNLDDVWMEVYRGDISGVKNRLLALVKENRKDYEDYRETDEYYMYGTESIEEIDERADGSLYAYVCFEDSHVDFVAKPLEEIVGFDFG